MNKLNDKTRKKALIGVVTLGIAAIVTVGILSINKEDSEETPNPLVDLNGELEKPGLISEEINPGGLAQITPTYFDPDTEEIGGQTVEAEGGSNTEPQPTEAPVQTASETEEPSLPEEQPATQTAEGNGENNEPGTVAAEEPEGTAAVLSPQVIAESLSFSRETGLLWPLQGKVIIPYSPAHGVFHFTLEQFRTSDAVVISAEVGTPVYAAAKGVVISIEENVRTGNTVKLALGNETYLVYGQLALNGLREGDIVEEGQCIGSVAEPTRYYVIEGGNLYFQVLEGEESVNPMLLLREDAE